VEAGPDSGHAGSTGSDTKGTCSDIKEVHKNKADATESGGRAVRGLHWPCNAQAVQVEEIASNDSADDGRKSDWSTTSPKKHPVRWISNKEVDKQKQAKPITPTMIRALQQSKAQRLMLLVATVSLCTRRRGGGRNTVGNYCSNTRRNMRPVHRVTSVCQIPISSAFGQANSGVFSRSSRNPKSPELVKTLRKKKYGLHSFRRGFLTFF
jgi:hypothetical protein